MGKINDKRRWNKEIVYQIYPRSFQDTNNDGIGDLQGIIAHLDYIKSLGASTIWISPIYKSPMVDMGYDISDYQKIDPQFGTMEDFDELLREANKRGIKIMMDLVVNHTSEQHEWFQKALASPTSPYRDYYIFKTSKNGQKPNNWRSLFGGSTWTEVQGEPGTYYFHTFAAQQPDLNWENPKLRQEIYEMINWWLDKGIAGFRIDAITHLKKDLDWASIPADGSDGLAAVIKKGQNRPGLDLFLDELKQETFDKHNAMTVGEAYGVPEDDLRKFIGPNGYFSMIFDFSYMNIEVKNADEWYRGKTNWDVSELKDTLFGSQRAIKNVDGWAANVLENHDQPRVLSKLIKDPNERTPTAAKALATMYYFLPGTPFIYQGQELGMKNFKRKKIDEFNDVSSINNYRMALKEGYSPAEALEIVNSRSRDNARTPMQWNDEAFGGFSRVTPWLKMGTDRKGINVGSEKLDPDSVLNYYREMSQLRKKVDLQDVFVRGELVEIKNVPQAVIAYKRVLDNKKVVILVNLSKVKQALHSSEAKVILNNYHTLQKDENELILLPYQAVILAE
ncbi:alpha-glucosidase [Liquorilactobacillus aquaticus DSM 21051]|uniref:Alpha-glucosidase n=1 Tax=Liquorilactobacillus aquaticus DSM 21051 TaxID=1423725 RepID=A0A0R2CUS6_9LACO|nr:alpha-glucosidase [Liquorilactobacillus aquaticus]KRM95125.1 alpha-glucosidase [Liquorilactobacillus aquaticus DSM 21051]